MALRGYSIYVSASNSVVPVILRSHVAGYESGNIARLGRVESGTVCAHPLVGD